MLNINKFDMNKFDISKLVPVQFINGYPDLVVRIETSVNSLWLLNQPNESSVITITVHNRLHFISRPPSLAASGSDAKDVVLYIQMSAGLQQVGGMVVPAGFQASVVSNHHTVYYFGGGIAAGESVVFVIEVIGEHPGGIATISAEANLRNLTTENLENNKASVVINVHEELWER
jgi:hypothetical protein